MTLAEFFEAVHAGGTTTLMVAALFPLVAGLIAWILNASEYRRASQTVANVTIAIGLVCLGIELCVLFFGGQFGVDVVRDVEIQFFAIPPYLVAAGFLAEHVVHPGRQEALRAQIRTGLLIVIALVVAYFILSRLQLHMLIWTSVFGFLLFVAFVIGLLYVLVRKLV